MAELFSARLKKLRERLTPTAEELANRSGNAPARGLTQEEMAARLGISKGYVWQLESGTKEPGPKLLREIALREAAPSLPPALPYAGATSIVAEDSPLFRDVPLPLRYVRLLSWAQAGAAAAWEQLPDSWQEQVPTDAHDPRAFAVTVRGDSMAPEYKEGEAAILLPSEEPRNGDAVVAKLCTDGVVLKIYHLSSNGEIVTLTSLNSAYLPLVLAPADLHWVFPIHSVLRRVRQ